MAPVMDGNRFDFKLGCLYVVAQLAGAATAALLQRAFATNGIPNDPYDIELFYYVGDFGSALLLEIVGAFMLVFMWLSTQNKATRFSEDMAINNAFLAGATIASMLIGGIKVPEFFLTPANPTIGFCIFFMNQTKASWKSFWLFAFIPWVGAALALGFYFCVYLKAKKSIDIDDAMSEEEEEESEEKSHRDSNEEIAA